MENEKNPLPIMLHHFRKKKNLTQAQVAEMLSISRSGYASFESGRIVPSFNNIVKLSKILEHDFLFAYTISTQNHLEENPSYIDYVFEEHPYIITEKENTSARNELQSAKLSDFDKELIDIYSLLRLKNKKGENE